MKADIALLRGDGIGPEIVDSTVSVLKKTAQIFGHTFNFTVFCTLWTVVFNFFKENTLSFYYS